MYSSSVVPTAATGTGEDDRRDGVVVDGGPSSPNAFLTTWFALLGGDRLQFGLADDVARRVYVGICGLEALVNADRPVRLSLDAQRL